MNDERTERHGNDLRTDCGLSGMNTNGATMNENYPVCDSCGHRHAPYDPETDTGDCCRTDETDFDVGDRIQCLKLATKLADFAVDASVDDVFALADRVAKWCGVPAVAGWVDEDDE